MTQDSRILLPQERKVADDAPQQPVALSASKRMPDFFIVGHPKCGTTALYEALRHHPQIYMPTAKEPNFFSAQWRTPAGPPETFDEYLSLFDAAKPDQRIGEASAFYLSSHNAASNIAEVQPDARIIAILREPASFLHSLHLQFVQSDFETEQSLRQALSLEDTRRRGQRIPTSASNWWMRLLYSDHVRYVEQLRRFHSLFPSERVMVLIYDDFRTDNETTLHSILRFLDVDDTFPISVPEANPTVRVRSRYLNRVLFREQGLAWKIPAGALKLLAPRQLRRYLWQSRHRVIYGAPSPLEERLMVELRSRFRPEVVALSEYLHRDLITLWDYDNIA